MNPIIRSTRLRGLRTAWLDTGDESKPILICLHGYPDDPSSWEFQREYFKDKYRVICPYTRGANPSEPAKHWKRYSHESTVLDLLQILKRSSRSNEAPITVMGHDMGAVQAWNLAEYLGPRLQALIIVNGISIQQMIGRFSRPAQHLRSWYIYGFQVPGIADLVARRSPDWLLRFAYERGGLPEEKRPDATTSQLCHPLQQYRAFVRHIPKMWARERIQIKKPVLMLWGKRDPYLLPPTEEEIAPFAKSATIRILDCGHWPHREKAREINRLIESFLGAIQETDSNASGTNRFPNWIAPTSSSLFSAGERGTNA